MRGVVPRDIILKQKVTSSKQRQIFSTTKRRVKSNEREVVQSMCISKCCLLLLVKAAAIVAMWYCCVLFLLYIRVRRTLGSVWRRRGTSFSLAFVTERMASLLPRSRRRRLDFTPAVHFPLEIGKSFRDGFFHVVVANSRVHSDFAF